MTGRELAWRVLATEVLSATHLERGEGEKAASFLVTPLGGRLNRVAMVGTVAPSPERDSRGLDPTLRATLVDPTGSIGISAGSFQPEGRSDLATIAGPTPALVVGKVTAPATGTSGPPTVRAEAVHPVGAVEYQALLAEAATQTLERLHWVEVARGIPPAGSGSRAGPPPSAFWAKGIAASMKAYPRFSAAPFYEAARAVLVALPKGPLAEQEKAGPSSLLPTREEVTRTVRARAPSTPPPLDRGLRALEPTLLDIVDDLCDTSPDGYADMDELAERAAKHGLRGESMEELLNALSENGTLEEPLVGKFRRAEGPPRE